MSQKKKRTPLKYTLQAAECNIFFENIYHVIKKETNL